MKKLFIYGTIVLMALTSCNDLLDKEPLDTFSNTRILSNTDNLKTVRNTFSTTTPLTEMEVAEDGSISKTLSDDQVDNDSHTLTYTNVVAKSSNWSDPFA